MSEAAELGSGSSRRGFVMMILISGSIVISFAGVLVRNIEAADVWQINFYRAMSQMAFVLIILIFQYRGKLFASILNVGRPGLFGGAALSVASICYLESITTTTVANTLFVLSAIPLITALLARIFLGERLRRETSIAILIATIGIAVMLGEGFGPGSLYGNLMGLLTALGFSTFVVTIRKHRKLDMLPTLLISTAIIALVSFGMKQGDIAVSTYDLMICLVWGFVLLGLANWTFIIASRSLEAAEVTFFMLLEFAIGPVWVWLFVGETASVWTLIGGVLVIGSVAARAAVQVHQARRSKRRPVPIASP